MTHRAEGAITHCQFHVEPVLDDPACPALDLAFSALLAWPTSSGMSGEVLFTDVCGARGSLWADADARSSSFVIDGQAPAGCGWGTAGSFTISGGAMNVRGEDAMLCSPVFLPICAGANGNSESASCPDGFDDESLYVEVGFTLALVRDSCSHGASGRQASVRVMDGVVEMSASGDSCHAKHPANIFGVPDTFDCPPGVGAPVPRIPWDQLLP